MDKYEQRRIRFLQLRNERCNGSSAEIARLIGKDPSYVARMLFESGKSGKKRIGEDVKDVIEKAFNLPIGWLDGRDTSASSSSLSPAASAPNVITLPMYDTGGAMGHGIDLKDQPGIIAQITVSPDWLQKNVKGFSAVGNLCVVTGFGDSMKGMYNPGDPLIVDIGVKTVDYDAVYFFRIGNEGFIKRLQRIPGRGLVAMSENKAYQDWTIEPSMDFEVFGRVVKAWESKDY
ncbi:COG2932 Predicted transcriptional regulator [uncultured Caudovirales phage]|uniref:COG2932 Predicted transcriptional regulator n=1 Tax=uncultured Caudovirales phage TaxID=2100421 RepID=A0A6J5LFT4_9CAUD|nr:COG2932 Predicted transcriptional regulator [uncultured Caudovirales phage]